MEKYTSMPVQFARGCPFQCDFCDIITIYGRKVRGKSSAQVITSERYLFPHAVLDSPQEISAAQPRIDVAWLAPGLNRALESAHVRGPGHGRLPVVIETTYVEDGDTTVDASLYDVGYEWKPRLFGGEHIRLDGLALVRRRVSGDERKVVDAVWVGRAPRGGG